MAAEKLAPTERHRFEHDGDLIYEWDQQLEEVNIYIPLPERLPTKLLYCTIKPKHLELGVKGNPPYLNVRVCNDPLTHDLAGAVKTDCSFWTIEDRVMHVTLQKREKGQPWPSAIAGHAPLDPLKTEQEKQRLMLERFQTEHPGFDFSNAEFNGNVPDPSKFLGGMQH
ncbi:uncharacterized protein [Physcomitrium patens]|nr:nudC domain-containing protein 2-like isoform X4 [Physcomitrium patens]|eukprot:XP_024398923.1 nudC domain-containing protein 2-like isoform X4 [Physcomitrella patens]